MEAKLRSIYVRVVFGFFEASSARKIDYFSQKQNISHGILFLKLKVGCSRILLSTNGLEKVRVTI